LLFIVTLLVVDWLPDMGCDARSRRKVAGV
jgi:hypothetical protein